MSTRGRRFPILGIAVVLVVMTGCGLPLDETPRAAEAPETSIPARSQTPEGGLGDSIIYFISANGNLNPVTRVIEQPSPEAVIEVLLDGPSDADRGAGRTTGVPGPTELIDITVDGSRVTVDLSEDFSEGVGVAGQQAAAQIVYTLSELEDITSVAFEVEGEPISVSSPNPETGDTDIVDRCDYFSLLPDNDEIEDEIESPELQDHTIALRAALSGSCPQIQPTPSVP